MLLYSVVLQEEWCWLWNVNQKIIKIITVTYIHIHNVEMEHCTFRQLHLI